jgi:biotin transport system substrate-specific component
VPITGQSFAVLLTGALLGPRLGAAAVIAYLIEGAIGLPFFAPGGASGILRFFGPTGGYLVAFPAAAFVTGAFAEHGWDKRYLTAVAAMAIGSAIIFLGGWAWFAVLTSTPPVAAFKIAVLPFLVGDVIKIALAAAVLPTGWALLKKK